ncbi:MAG: helix-turn-helix transcriptional regulator [Bacteroidetes bacterium]|nr:helix-turn-helix transcriptional regulator [Bacteroidota bacterium]
MKIGNKIKKIRELKNYTQEYMANELSMSISNYSKIERDEISVTLDRLNEIAIVLKMKFQDILAFDEKNVFNFINSPHSQGYINNYMQTIIMQMKY